ncbi:FAD-dependent oxidoreductase [Candidatus Saccharibacteria bacterium]|nr:FAD-dependent oxidoreductase [Candidatus Saccharibacteria bacterium]
MKVVIVGGGFGGVRAALNLARRPGFDVTLVSKQSYFEYHPALYRSATGRSPLEVAIPLADFFASDNNLEVVEDEIVSLDHQKKSVTGKSGSVFRYDALILATGAVTQYFGIKGLRDYSYGIKTIQEALELKRHLHEDLVAGHRAERSYVVIGGGATGVELAGELVGYLNHVRRRHGINTKFSVDLVEASPRVLPSLPESFTNQIERRLQRLRVKLHLKTLVKSESADQIKLLRGDIESHTVIWTAGIANNPFFAQNPNAFKLDKSGKVVVNEYLEAMPGVYVIGDSAATQFSGMAQTAIHDANLVTTNLKRQLKHKTRLPYQPAKPIYAIPAGPGWSAVLWGRTKIYGRPGWLLRRLADLRLYLRFLPLKKALTTWRYGFDLEESCPICR